MTSTTNKVDDPCQECRERHLKCDDDRPRCKQCDRLGEKCHRSRGRLKFRPGSSAKYDSTFGKDQTWLFQSRNAKIQFVDQGPELENFYSQDDDGDIPIHDSTDTKSDSLETSSAPLKRSSTSSTIDTGLSPEPRSPIDHGYSRSSLPILSPTSTVHSGSNPRSPLKRSLADDNSAPASQRRVEPWAKQAFDPVRTSYRLYDPPRPQNPYDLESPAFVTEHANVPKIVEAAYQRLADSAAAAIPDEVLLTPAIWKDQFYWPNSYTTTQCSCLMKYFIEKLAPWFDVGDPERNFELAVPQRARRCPPLLNAIFTAAARHLTLLPQYRGPDRYIHYEGIRLAKLTDETCLSYHQACIAYLKRLAGDPNHVQDENLLAAAVILRYYEELDCALRDRDSEASLATFNLYFRAQASSVNSAASPPLVPTDAWSQTPTSNHHRPRKVTRELALNHLKSFQHACFRVALRQETTTAFMKQHTVHLPLCSTWTPFDVFDEDAPDFVWADRHLHHCAKVLQFCYGDSTNSASSNPLSLSNITNPPTHQSSIDRWRTLKSYQDDWERAKPLSFSPLHYQSSDAHNSFPMVWYMAETHVIALQYLDLARILLTVYDPSTPRLGPGASSAQKRANAEIREIVMRLCGTAISSPASQPARMQAYTAVTVCGERFEDRGEQKALLDLLVTLETDFGWPTGRTRTEMRSAWGWDD